MLATPNLRPPSLNASIQSYKSKIAELRYMNEGFKIRIVISIPKDLLDKINRHIKAQPNTRDAKIIKCIREGYNHIMSSQAETPAELRAANPA
jgi:hypothetical protein